MKLKELRVKKRLSQEELGKILGVSGQTILNWENCIHSPNVDQLIKLADFFDVSIDYLVGLKNENKTKNEIMNDLKDNSKEDLLKIIENYIDEIIKSSKKS